MNPSRAAAPRKRRVIYTLRPLMSMVEVTSRSDGLLIVDPRWRKSIKPGVMTRIAASQRMAYLLNQYLKRRKLP